MVCHILIVQDRYHGSLPESIDAETAAPHIGFQHRHGISHKHLYISDAQLSVIIEIVDPVLLLDSRFRKIFYELFSASYGAAARTV